MHQNEMNKTQWYESEVGEYEYWNERFGSIKLRLSPNLPHVLGKKVGKR